jgi:gamma-glutamylcyclotransferase (GGCT)/AIG2-like uncharacterized protein YtfP
LREADCGVSALGPQAAMIPYFAYGSNMCLAQMRRRCPGARVVGPAVLERHRFVIVRPGYASVRREPGARVRGLLWQLTPRDLAALHVYEGLDWGLYRVVWRPVRTACGTRAALVYVAGSHVQGRPRIDYLNGIVAAADALQSPQAYMRALTRHAVAGAPNRPVRRLGDLR